ncbi:MAG: YeeE/YedE family protein [Gammaproteobacteria bacterium]|nr:YeeE/YedE family protein [Gammaproteobacteria bacterium]
MKIRSSALFAGALFGVGLSVSGMANPDKVMNFLNLLGQWDASLVFVLGGAVVTTFIGYRLSWKRKAPLFEDQFYLPTKTMVDKQLLIGAALFGAGWGMTGFCPGPALAGLAFGHYEPWLFTGSMLLGYFIIEKFINLPKEAKAQAELGDH